MGKASRTKVDSSRRERLAAQRAAERRAEQRRRILIAAGAILAVVAIVVVIIVVKPGSNSGTNTASNGPTGAALASVVNDVTNVPASTLDKVANGSGEVTSKPAAISGGTPLTANGKPEMLYMGAEYCPYCAAERWSMIVALSRFGTFSGLSTIHSSTTDTPANIPTWTFHGSSYTSKYLTFTPVEMQTNVVDPSTGQYPVLEKPTAAQQALLTKYDAPPYVASADAGAIPFIYFGGKYLSVGATYDPTVLNGKNWDQIASALSDPNSAIAKAIGGSANHITAAICKMTGNQPASACTATIQSLEKSL
jgi:thiol-disulfide isomerase/thioredoxin